jgi:hypothetical protein
MERIDARHEKQPAQALPMRSSQEYSRANVFQVEAHQVAEDLQLSGMQMRELPGGDVGLSYRTDWRESLRWR